jgi:hypothetical protein
MMTAAAIMYLLIYWQYAEMGSPVGWVVASPPITLEECVEERGRVHFRGQSMCCREKRPYTLPKAAGLGYFLFPVSRLYKIVICSHLPLACAASCSINMAM